jgi:WD40 repeat protein
MERSVVGTERRGPRRLARRGIGALAATCCACSAAPVTRPSPIESKTSSNRVDEDARGAAKADGVLQKARAARVEGRLERALRLLEFASKSGAKVAARELEEVRSSLSDEGVSAEEWLARARASESADPLASREAFERARLAFEKRIGERARGEIDGELGSVNNVGFVGGSTRFAVSGLGGYDLWDLTQRELLRRFRFDAPEEYSVVSADGLWFATSNRLYDGEGRRKLEFPPALGYSFVRGDREFLASLGGERKTKRWLLPSLAELSTLPFELQDLAPCGPDALIGVGEDLGSPIGASGERGLRVEIRSLESGKLERTFSVDRYVSAACAGDKVVLAGLFDVGVRVFSRRTGRLLKTYPDVDYVSTSDVGCKPTVSRDGKLVTHSSRGLGSTVIDLAGQRVLYSGKSDGDEPNERGVICAAVAPDGKHLVEVAADEGRLWVRELPSGRLLWERGARSQFYASALAWSPETSRLALGRSSRVDIIDLRGGARAASIPLPSRVTRLRWVSPDRLVATPSLGKSLFVIDARRGSLEKVVPIPRVDSTKLVVTKTRLALLEGGNNVLIPLDLVSPPKTVPGVLSALAASGEWYVTLSPAGLEVKSVDGSKTFPLTVPNEELYRSRELEFSPDDRLLTRHAGDALIFWDFRAGREVGRTQGGLGGQRIVRHRFSRDGAELRVLLANDSIVVFAVPSGKLLRSFGANQDAGEAGVALERSGWRLRNGVAELWSADGRLLIELVGGNEGDAWGFWRTPSGLIEPLDPRQPPPLCAIGTWRFPWGLCAGRLEGKDLLARVNANDPLLEEGL